MINSGERFRADAATHNKLIDALNDPRAQRGKRGRDRTDNAASLRQSRSVVKTRNIYPEDRPRFDAVELRMPALTVNNNVGYWKSRPYCESVPSVPPYGWAAGNGAAVVPMPLKQDQFGYCVAAGIVPAQVEMILESHRCAYLLNGVFRSANYGSAEIFYVEPGTGLKWAIVRLKHNVPSLFPARFQANGGSGGSPTTYASYTYDAYFWDTDVQITPINTIGFRPDFGASPHFYTRNKGARVAATFGFFQILRGGAYVVWCNEYCTSSF